MNSNWKEMGNSSTRKWRNHILLIQTELINALSINSLSFNGALNMRQIECYCKNEIQTENKSLFYHWITYFGTWFLTHEM